MALANINTQRETHVPRQSTEMSHNIIAMEKRRLRASCDGEQMPIVLRARARPNSAKKGSELRTVHSDERVSLRLRAGSESFEA